MTTDQQTEANRQNAQKSTGPRTEEGKAHSSMNAVKSGIYSKSLIIRGESSAALEEVIANFNEHCQPANPLERDQVDILIRCTWRARRYDRAETELWNYTIDDFSRPSDTPLAKAFIQRTPTLNRLDRLIDANERRLRQATAELERLQADRRAAEEEAPKQAPEPEPAPPPQPVKSETTYHEIGFVPQTPDTPAPDVAAAPKIGFLAANSGFRPGRKGGRR